MDHSQIVDGGFLKAAEDASKLLESPEESFDDVAAAIGFSVKVGMIDIIGLLSFFGDHRLNAFQVQLINDRRRAIGFVPRQGVRLDEVLPLLVGHFRRVPQVFQELRLVGLSGAEFQVQGLHAKLVDGFPFTMPGTAENQAEAPHPRSQKADVGLPLARCLAILSLATAAVLDVALGPYSGKETGETALLRWMDQATYDTIPATLLLLRELQFQVTQPSRRTTVITILTTRTDAEVYTKADLAELYGFRWNAELEIRAIKQNLNLNHVRCKSPEMVRRELWVTLLASNLVRTTAAAAALLYDRRPRQISFTGTCQ